MIDVDAMRAEIPVLHDEIARLKCRRQAAREDGDDDEVRRLSPQIDEAAERLVDTEGVVGVCEAFSLTESQPEGWTDLNRCARALDRLLWYHDGDGVRALELVAAGPTQVILAGRIWWVWPQSNDVGDLLETTFDFDEDSRALERLVVRAGDIRSNADTTRDFPGSDWSAREMARRIARRPENDAQWAIVIGAGANGLFAQEP